MNNTIFRLSIGLLMEICFSPFLAIVNRVAMNIHVRDFVCTSRFISLEGLLRRGMAKLYG